MSLWYIYDKERPICRSVQIFARTWYLKMAIIHISSRLAIHCLTGTFAAVTKVRSHLATTTQIFDIVSINFSMSSLMGYTVTNVTVRTWRQKKNIVVVKCWQTLIHSRFPAFFKHGRLQLWLIHSRFPGFFYRPQTKFAKVMFLHLSVSHSVHGGGVCLSACWDTHPSRLPWEQISPHLRADTHHPAQCMLGDTGNKQAVCILLIFTDFFFIDTPL